MSLLFALQSFGAGLPALAQDKQEHRTFTVSGIVKLDGPVPKAKLNKALTLKQRT